MYYLQDLTPGMTFELGTTSVSKDEIIEFAEKYDPQRFHLDEAVGTKMFGGLIASGWQTASLASRLIVDNFLGKAACMASPGVDELRFVRPLMADTQLTGTLTIIDATPSKSKPDRGMARMQIVLANDDGDPVLTMIGLVMIGCRPE